MTMRMIIHDDGRSFVVGGRKTPDPALLDAAPKLARYLGDFLPPPALRADWATGPALNKAGLENIKGNDQLGDCVEVAVGNLTDIWHGDAGTGISVSADQTIAFYSASSDYVVGQPSTDQGSDPVTVANYWKANGFAPGLQPIAGFVTIDPTNVVALKTAVALFGGIMIGGALLTSWVNGMQTMQSGFTWTADSPSDPQAGHEVLGFGFNTNGIFIATWGLFGTLTWTGIAQFAAAAGGGSVIVPLSADWIVKASAVSPSGFKFPQLEADLAAL
jgi:hypothetical protein